MRLGILGADSAFLELPGNPSRIPSLSPSYRSILFGGVSQLLFVLHECVSAYTSAEQAGILPSLGLHFDGFGETISTEGFLIYCIQPF